MRGVGSGLDLLKHLLRDMVRIWAPSSEGVPRPAELFNYQYCEPLQRPWAQQAVERLLRSWLVLL